jgi:hypothetical protein
MARSKSARTQHTAAPAASPHASVSDLSPAQLAAALKGIAWWNNLPLGERRYWLLVTKGGSVAGCWKAYKAHSVAKGTKSGLTEYHLLEDGACIAVLFDPGCAREFRDNMIQHGDGHEYEFREVRP